MLPPPISDALSGGRSAKKHGRCGNRDDGSGQIIVNSKCFVRVGVSAPAENHRQRFLACAVVALDNPAIQDIAQLVAAVRANLSAADFVTLDGGRVARRFAEGLDPLELLADAGALEDLKTWLRTDRTYVQRFSLRAVADRSSRSGSKSSKSSKSSSSAVRWPPTRPSRPMRATRGASGRASGTR